MIGSSKSSRSSQTKIGRLNYTYPPGTILYVTGDLPSWTLPTYGQTVSRDAYPHLFNMIGYAYGGEGKLFTLPNSGYRAAIVTIRHAKRSLWANFRLVLAWILIGWAFKLVPVDDPDIRVYAKCFKRLAKGTT